MCGGREKNRRGRHDVLFFFFLFFSLASPFIYSSFDRLLVLAISERENAFSDVAGREEGEGEDGRDGTYNVATSSRRLDAGFGTVQQVDEQVSRFPSFEFAFPSLRRVVAARFSFTNLLRNTTPFGYHLS